MFWINILVILIVFAIPGWARGEYPDKSIQIINPNVAGGSLDVSVRIISEKMAGYLGQPVLVMNKPGGGSALGTAFVASSKPDGYTLLTVPPTHVSLPLTTLNLPYKASDFVPVGRYASFSHYVVVHKDLPVKTLAELVAHVKKNPRTLSYSTSGFGGNTHLIAELLKLNHQLDLQYVPSAGEFPAVTALVGNHVQVAVLSFSTAQSHIKSGAIRALAVLSAKRDPIFPQVPTSVEQGFPELVTTGYFILLAPAKIPVPILSKLESTLEKAVQDEGVRERFRKIELTPYFQNSQDTQALLDSEVQKWSQIIKKVGIVIK